MKTIFEQVSEDMIAGRAQAELYIQQYGVLLVDEYRGKQLDVPLALEKMADAIEGQYEAPSPQNIAIVLRYAALIIREKGNKK